MPRATVRAAIASYLESASQTNIPFLGKVNQWTPKLTPEGDFVKGEDPGISSGAVVYIFLKEHSERRIALGGATSGRKARPYSVALICFFRSTKPTTQAVEADNDTFLDGLTSWIQANRTANSNGVVFQWGEGDVSGGIDIHVTATMPRLIRLQMSQVFSVVEVTVLEILDT